MIVLLADFELFFEIDDAGFVALVCPGAYAGYVGEDWTLEQVTGRFVEQMNARNLFIAYPGPDSAGEPLRVSNRPSRMAARREASGLLRVGDDGLWLTDYAQLTMAAQFKDEPPAAGHHVRLSIPAGAYLATLRQFSSSIPAELVIREAGQGERPFPFNAVPWLR